LTPDSHPDRRAAHLDQRRSYGRYHDVLDTIRNAPSGPSKTAFDFGRRRGGQT
jgi:hypothetical protein